MENLRRFFGIFAMLFLITLLVFGGCGKNKNTFEEGKYEGEVYPENGLPKDQKVTLKIIFAEAGYGSQFMIDAMESFKQKFPNVDFNYRLVEGVVAYQNIVKSLLQANDDKEMYDWFENIPGSGRLREVGKLEKQDELWEMPFYDTPNVRIKDSVFGKERELTSIDGHTYTVKTQMSVVGLFFNREVFRGLGLPESPSDWNEFLKLCQKIKENGLYPMVMAGKFPGYFEYGWGVIPHELEPDEFYDAQYYKKPNLYLRKGYIGMLERLEEFVKKGYLHPGTLSFDHTQSQMEFLQKKAAMITNGSWIANEMSEVMPANFEWGFMPFPGNDSGQKQVVISNASGVGFIWKNRPELNKKWAKEFNRWLLNMDLQKVITKNGAMSIRKDFPIDFEGISPSLKVAMEVIQKRDLQIISTSVSGKELFNTEAAKIDKVRRDNLVALVMGEIDAKKAAKETNNQLMKALAEENKLSGRK